MRIIQFANALAFWNGGVGYLFAGNQITCLVFSVVQVYAMSAETLKPSSRSRQWECLLVFKRCGSCAQIGLNWDLLQSNFSELKTVLKLVQIMYYFIFPSNVNIHPNSALMYKQPPQIPRIPIHWYRYFWKHRVLYSANCQLLTLQFICWSYRRPDAQLQLFKNEWQSIGNIGFRGIKTFSPSSFPLIIVALLTFFVSIYTSSLVPLQSRDWMMLRRRMVTQPSFNCQFRGGNSSTSSWI